MGNISGIVDHKLSFISGKMPDGEMFICSNHDANINNMVMSSPLTDQEGDRSCALVLV